MNATTALLQNELRQVARTPAVYLWTILLPVVAIIVMSVIPGAREPLPGFGGLSVVEAYQPTLVVFTITIIALQLLPMQLGQYRKSGYLRRLQTTPAHAGQLLGAVLAMIFIIVAVTSVFLLAFPLFFGVGTVPGAATQFGIMVLTALAMLSVGTMISAVIPSPNVAGGVGATLAVVMWFFAGMWVPRAQFPDWVATIADWTPGGAAATLLEQAGAGEWLAWQPVLCLGLWAVGGFLVAIRAFKWQ